MCRSKRPKANLCRYYLLAYDTTISVYSVPTKLLVRTLAISQSGYITGYSIPFEEQSQLFVSLSTGYIEKWDWHEGKRTNTFQTGLAIANLTHSTKGSQGFIYTIERKRKTWSIVAHGLKIGGSDAKGVIHVLYKSREPVSHFRVMYQGRFVIATAGKNLILGSADAATTDPTYTWRELECREWITCLDVRGIDGEPKRGSRHHKKSKPDTSNPASFDVVVGGLQGSLYVYRDLFRKLFNNENGNETRAPIPQRLHWHRNGVGAVRWILNGKTIQTVDTKSLTSSGDYLISGGSETVLVRWQLDTGQSTMLPHLSAPIESIVLSSSERLYSIRFASNTAMILSSADLEPILNIPGLRIRTRRPAMIKPPEVSYVSSLSKDTQIFNNTCRPAAAIIPGSGRLLLAVAGSSPPRNGLPISSNAPLLQTLDVRDGSQVSLQALTRTNTTIKTQGPEANLITEPNVILLQTSHDGQWLATVDEWAPPSIDFEGLSFDQAHLVRQRISHMEINLKIWSKTADAETWELVAKMITPHEREEGSAATPERILDLIHDPSSLGFVTVGTDAKVKVWRAKRRLRDGQQVLGQDGAILSNWYCESSLNLPVPLTTEATDIRSSTGRLACSSDGSLIVAAYQEHVDSPPFLFILATSPLEIHCSLPGLLVSGIASIALISWHLILVSEELCVYDLVNYVSQFSYKLAVAPGLSKQEFLGLTRLAVDYTMDTFAIATPEGKNGSEDAKSELAVFDPTDPEPLYFSNFKQNIVTLLPLDGPGIGGENGYIILDAAACIRHVKPKQKELAIPRSQVPQAGPKRLAGLESLFGAQADGNKASIATNGFSDGTGEIAADEMEVDEDETPFVKAHQLNEALDLGSLYNLPRVDDLFDKVAGLYISLPTD